MSDSSNSNDPLNRPFRGFSRDATRRATDRIHGNPDSNDEYEANDGEEEDQDAQEDYDTDEVQDEEREGDVDEEVRPEQSEEVIAGIAKVRAAFGGRGLFARTETGEPVVNSPEAQETQAMHEEESLVPEHVARDGGTREMVREAKEAYLNQLASSKWGENHNRARKAYTVALETHLHAQMLLLQTDARIRLGEERLEAERRKKLGESVVFKDVEREAEFQEALENDPGYQRGAEKMAEEVVRVQNELYAEDPSFDATAAVTMNLELYALLAPHLNDVVDGPARAIFDAMSEQVFTPQEEEALKDTIVDMYLVQRAQYLAGYQAHLLGHSRPRESVLGAFTVEDSEFRAMQKAYKLTQKAVERMLKREGFSTEHLQREDTEAINTIRQYWLSGFKKARVPKTAEKVRTQKKGGIGRMAAAVLAFIAAWSHDPNAPQEPQVRFEQDMRGAGNRASEGGAEEVRQEAISVPAQRTGAIDTFSILLSRMTPEAREVLYAGLEQSAGNSLPESDRLLLASARKDQGTYSHGALFVARQLGFVRENRREEPRIYRDSQFVYDESGIRVVRGRTEQLLVNSDNQKVADYRDR